MIENGRDDASIASRSEQNVVELCFPDTSENQRNTCSHSTTIEHYIRTCVNVDILCPECDDVTPLSGFQNLMHQFTKNDRITKPASKRIEKSVRKNPILIQITKTNSKKVIKTRIEF